MIESMPERRLHVLATDDDPGICALLCAFLTEEGYRVSLSSALDVAEVRRLAPDLILLDYWITGAAFLERLKADPVTATVPILVLTGAQREVDKQATHLADLDVAVLLKPFDLDDLLRQVRRRLNGEPA
jgi:DNA-binding response OmpR family regulator